MNKPKDQRSRGSSGRSRKRSARQSSSKRGQSRRGPAEPENRIRKRRTTQQIDPYASVSDTEKPENIRSRKRESRQSKETEKERARRKRSASRRSTQEKGEGERGRSRRRSARRATNVLEDNAPTTRRLRETIDPAREDSAERRRGISRETKRFRTNILRENVEIREAERAEQAKARESELERQRRERALSDPHDVDIQYSGKGERLGIDSRIATVLVIMCALTCGVIVMLLMREAPKADTKPKYVAKREHTTTKTVNTDDSFDPPSVTPSPVPQGVKAPKHVKFVEDAPQNPSLLGATIVNKSPQHKTLASFLEEFNSIRQDQSGGDGINPFEGYRERQRRENELLEQIKSLGPDALLAMSDLITELSGHPFQMFLARAVGSMDADSARETSAKLLVELKDYSVRMQLVKSLPMGPDSTDVIGKSIAQVNDANLRVMLVRELAHRTRDADSINSPDVAEHFTKLALEDKSPTVRAEAIAVMGRRKLDGQRDILEQIVRDEKHATVRQRAIVSLARTAGESSLTTLREVAVSKAEDSVRASAVLGLTLIGGPALQVLEDIARDDASSDIRNRAKRAIQSIQRAQASAPVDGDFQPGQ